MTNLLRAVTVFAIFCIIIAAIGSAFLLPSVGAPTTLTTTRTDTSYPGTVTATSIIVDPVTTTKTQFFNFYTAISTQIVTSTSGVFRTTNSITQTYSTTNTFTTGVTGTLTTIITSTSVTNVTNTNTATTTMYTTFYSNSTITTTVANLTITETTTTTCQQHGQGC